MKDKKSKEEINKNINKFEDIDKLNNIKQERIKENNTKNNDAINNNNDDHISKKIDDIKNEFNIDNELDNDLYFTEDELKLENKIYDQITKDIKRKISRFVYRSIAIVGIVIIASLFIINPIIKSRYPDFKGLNDSNIRKELKKASISEKIKYWLFRENPENINFYSDTDDLTKMVHNFFSTVEPFSELSHITVIDNKFGNYGFIVNMYDHQMVGTNQNNEYSFEFKRGTISQSPTPNKYFSDFFFPSNYYSSLKNNVGEKNESEYNKELIKSIEELPNSSYISASVFTKNLESVHELVSYIKKNHQHVRMYWLPIIDDYSYNKIINLYETHNKKNNGYGIYRLGINVNNQIEFQKVFDNIYSNIEKYDDKLLKKTYLKNLENIKNNYDIFSTFSGLNSIHFDLDNTNKNEISIGYSVYNSPDFSEVPFEADEYYSINKYIQNIKNSDKFLTNSFTATLSKNDLLKLLKDDKILTANIMSVNLSTYNN